MEKVLTKKILCNDKGAIERAKRATNAGGGKKFAEQTEKNLPSYRPNVLSTSNELDCHARPADGGNGARNDEKEIFPLSGEADCELRASLCGKMAKPLQAQGADPLNASNQAGARRAGEGKTFAQQTEKNLPSYRPNVLTTSNKLDCHARPADSGNGARNDEKPLVPQYLSALVPSKKVAFTLAEVLITLGIIGVVAALTIPNTVNDYRERKKVVKLKKVYAQLSEIYDRATSEKGFVSDRFAKYSTLYSTEGNIAFRDYFMSYYKVSVEGTQNEAYQTSGYTAFWDKLSGTRYGWCRDDNSMATFADNTGTAYAFRLLPPNKHCVGNFGAYADNISVCGEIFVDLYPNPKSLSKPKYEDIPSRTVGKDIFMFHVTKDGIVPAGVSDDMSKCYKDGWSCAQWVILNENMDYLHCKDLDWNGKHKCD